MTEQRLREIEERERAATKWKMIGMIYGCPHCGMNYAVRKDQRGICHRCPYATYTYDDTDDKGD